MFRYINIDTIAFSNVTVRLTKIRLDYHNRRHVYLEKARFNYKAGLCFATQTGKRREGKSRARSVPQ